MERISPNSMLTGLKRVAPSIAITVEREEDPYFVWDGDGPDPAKDGFIAYNVDVFARAIVDGDTVEGRSSLGGVYEKPGQEDADIHGYFAQMAEEALGELVAEVSGSVKKQAQDAKKFLKDVMSWNYEDSHRRRR
jgi:hypothetical protein